MHPRYKTKYRVGNWLAYDRALVQRGDVTLWLTPEAIATWEAVGVGKRGGQLQYSEVAIETALTLRLIFHLPLRQTEGFLRSIFGMLCLDLSAPDHTTLSRRGQHLDLALRRLPAGAGMRDRNAAIAFFRKTVGASPTTPPRVVNVDKNPAYPIAFEAIKHDGFFRPRSSLRQCKYLNNVIEQDHRFIKRRTRPMLGFKRFTTAWRTVRGIEMMHALRKGQARWMAKGDVVGQTRLIHKVFGLAV